MLAKVENFVGLARINRELIGKVEAFQWHYRAVLDMDATEIPVYGEQEQSAYNGHFESTCYHPLLLFNRDGDCLAAQLRPGNVHSAEGWEKLLLPEIDRQQRMGKEIAFRADAAFAKPEVYEALERTGCEVRNSHPGQRYSAARHRRATETPRGKAHQENRWSSTRGSCTRQPVGRRLEGWWRK